MTNVEEAQAVTDRGERDRAVRERDQARAALVEAGQKLEAALVEVHYLNQQLRELRNEGDAELKRARATAQDLRAQLDYAHLALDRAALDQPAPRDSMLPSSVAAEDAEREHAARNLAAREAITEREQEPEPEPPKGKKQKKWF